MSFGWPIPRFAVGGAERARQSSSRGAEDLYVRAKSTKSVVFHSAMTRPSSGSPMAWGQRDRSSYASGASMAVASGFKFTVAAALLSVLVVTHGIGSYAAKLGGHKRHRDALMFVGAQDLSVLAALLLWQPRAREGLSVDAKYGKGN